MRTAIALSTAGVLLLTACGSQRDDRAVTVERSDTPTTAAEATGSTPEPSASNEEVAAPDEAAGRSLTREQLEAALPTIQDLPTGWSVVAQGDEALDDDDVESTVSPPECEAVFDALGEQDTEPVAEAAVDFGRGELGPFLDVSIASYEEALEPGRLQAAADALSTCPDFSVEDPEQTVNFSASALSFPNLGDETLAIRLAGDIDDFAVTADQVLVVVGANVVSLTALSLMDNDPAALEAAARAAVDGLAEVE